MSEAIHQKQLAEKSIEGYARRPSCRAYDLPASLTMSGAERKSSIAEKIHAAKNSGSSSSMGGGSFTMTGQDIIALNRNRGITRLTEDDVLDAHMQKGTSPLLLI